MIFRKLKRVWSYGEMDYIPKFRETFPELCKVSNEELCTRWKKLNIEFYSEENVTVKGWIRLSLPFAVLLFIVMLIGLPFVFIITGKWSYGNGNKSIILNWFRALHLV